MSATNSVSDQLYHSVDWDNEPPEYIVPPDPLSGYYTAIFTLDDDKLEHYPWEAVGVAEKASGCWGYIYRKTASGRFKLWDRHEKHKPKSATLSSTSLISNDCVQCGGSGLVAGFLGVMMIPCECRKRRT